MVQTLEPFVFSTCHLWSIEMSSTVMCWCQTHTPLTQRDTCWTCQKNLKKRRLDTQDTFGHAMGVFFSFAFSSLNLESKLEHKTQINPSLKSRILNPVKDINMLIWSWTDDLPIHIYFIHFGIIFTYIFVIIFGILLT